MTADDATTLIEHIKADCAAAQGGSTRETRRIVEVAIVHYLTMDVSDAFEQALEEYRAQLKANVEDVESQRLTQRILAAMKRKQGIFFLEDKWGVRLNEWLDGHQDAVPLVESLDDLYRIAPKGKPTRKWLTSVEKVFKDYSKQAVVELLRGAITLLLETKEVASTGLCFDNEDKLRVMVLILAIGNHEEDSELLGQLAELAYNKIPGIGAVSTGVGNQCIQALAGLQGTRGVVVLSELASQLKYPKTAVGLVNKKLEEVAKEKGVTVKELQSMSVPDYGLGG